MDTEINQFISREQQMVLSALANSVAKKGCEFLEIGSWIGDSTVVLAKVAKENGGHLFCVDWWNGSIGTELMDIAASKDVFSSFWKRICREGLENTVIPIRSKSDIVANILKKDSFDLVFIDADHIYEAVLADIKNYLPLVKKSGGILCGHDCEGRIIDFNRTFLESGKNMDAYESVHCGVVLAVGLTFADYSIDHGVWSVKRLQEGWVRTELKLENLTSMRQPLPPPVGSTANYDLYRYGDSIYAVPRNLKEFDVTKEENRIQPQIKRATSIEEVIELIQEGISSKDFPVLLDAYMGFNLVRYKEYIYGIDQALGDLDLVRIKIEEIKEYQKNNSCVIAGSVDGVKLLVLGIKHAILENNLKDKEETIKTLQVEVLKSKDDRARFKKSPHR